jgi:hypothetical protein
MKLKSCALGGCNDLNVFLAISAAVAVLYGIGFVLAPRFVIGLRDRLKS